MTLAAHGPSAARPSPANRACSQGIAALKRSPTGHQIAGFPRFASANHFTYLRGRADFGDLRERLRIRTSHRGLPHDTTMPRATKCHAPFTARQMARFASAKTMRVAGIHIQSARIEIVMEIGRWATAPSKLRGGFGIGNVVFNAFST